MNRADKLIEVTMRKIIEEVSKIQCPKCGSTEYTDTKEFSVDKNDLISDILKCNNCNTEYIVVYKEGNIDAECPNCGSEGSLGDPQDNLDTKTVVYDCICDNCGANWDVEGDLKIIDVKLSDDTHNKNSKDLASIRKDFVDFVSSTYKDVISGWYNLDFEKSEPTAVSLKLGNVFDNEFQEAFKNKFKNYFNIEFDGDTLYVYRK